MIKITSEYIQFETATQLRDFAERYSTDNARFEFEFFEPVHAGGGEVYIPAESKVAENQLDRLDQYDQHNPHYRIKHTPLVLKFYAIHLRKSFADILKSSREDFLLTLYEGISGGAIGGIITHALFDPRQPQAGQLTFWLLKIYEQDRDFFHHLARCGLLALGVAFSAYERRSYLHRFAFQMGLLGDAMLVDQKERKISLYNRDPGFQREYAGSISQSAQSLGLAEEIVYALRNHLDQTVGPEGEGASPEAFSLFDSVTEDIPEKDDQSAGRGIELQSALLAIMRVTRFLSDVERNQADPVVCFQEMIAGLSYLQEKEILPEVCAQPILNRSRDHIEIIKKMKRIAQIEKSCIMKDNMAAWAYPKPNATQVICIGHYEDCPNLLRGRPINVVGMGDGILSRFQVPGEYQKCKLAEQLEP